MKKLMFILILFTLFSIANGQDLIVQENELGFCSVDAAGEYYIQWRY